MRNNIVFMILILCITSMAAQNINRISKDVQVCHYNMEIDHHYSDSYFYLRNRVEVLKRIHSDLKHDTIYVLEFHGDLPTKNLYSILWNNSDTLYYEAEDYGKGKLKLDEKNYMYSSYMCYLVSKWDYDELKKQGELYPSTLTTEYVYATRIVIKSRKFYVDCMRFRVFVNPKRDKFDY